MNNSLQPAEITSLKSGDPVPVMNPLNAEMSVMRSSLIQGGLTTVKNNLNAGEKDLRLFETWATPSLKTSGEIDQFV
ncbi:hypothetical protein MASR1M107_07590 [Ignavibacteriales bacterium]